MWAGLTSGWATGPGRVGGAADTRWVLSLPEPLAVLGEPAPPLGGCLSSSLGSMEEKLCAEYMAAAACSTKAMSLFKRTLVLSPGAAPRGAGTPPRGCSFTPAAWPSKDRPRGEGVCCRLRSPVAASRAPQSHSSSSASPTAVCVLCPQDSLSSSLKTCYKYLNQTSRSFAAVIQALDGEMR